MVLLFKQAIVPRTHVASHNPVLYDNGNGLCEFYTPASKYFGKQVIPLGNKWSDGSPSFMAPISHFHLLQTESFHVESGTGLWYAQGKKIQLKAGEDITIPRCVGHKFENQPGSKEPLVILYRYDSQRWEMEERFFRNALTYLDDCRKAGVAPSLLQLCIFTTDAWMPPDIIPCPGGEYVRCLVNTLFMWVLAFVGYFIYGYKRSYPEYYDPGIVKKRIRKDLKKGQ